MGTTNTWRRSSYSAAILLMAMLGCQKSDSTSDTGTRTTPPNAGVRQRLLDQAKSFLEVKDFDTALACYTEAIRLEPSNSEGYRLRAGARLAKISGPSACAVCLPPGMADEFLADYGHAIRLDPKNAAVYKERAKVYLLPTYRKFDLAVADCSIALSIDAKDADALVGRAKAYREKGDKKQALADCMQALAMDPKHAEGLLCRARLHEEMGDLATALADLTAAVQADPKNAQPYLARASLYQRKMHDPDKAVQDYLEVVRLDAKPGVDKSLVRKTMGGIYRDAGELDKAIAEYTEAIRLNPTQPLAYGERAVAYKKAGKVQEAEADLERSKELGPPKPDWQPVAWPAWWQPGWAPTPTPAPPPFPPPPPRPPLPKAPRPDGVPPPTPASPPSR